MFPIEFFLYFFSMKFTAIKNLKKKLENSLIKNLLWKNKNKNDTRENQNFFVIVSEILINITFSGKNIIIDFLSTEVYNFIDSGVKKNAVELT